ncbi:hypothetical protein AB1Y20_019510 [Prymnesium parvum]|uniref:Nudix hydrolase domain-containing protein n=1 Tax=Prymnesium parvum TaxID=97485 RepID=A0AB34JUK6_PRYPA|mmetsp:Transcript_4735/g.10455  ORF Transcript_4735/g.10455 Transcript_4735/m.10455 type:complete len:149 (-) Transcript_4735:35-481(-)
MPKGAVAIVCMCSHTRRFALVSRSRPPDVGRWSLPGGKVERGEATMRAAMRELCEETGLGREDVCFSAAPFTVSDVIDPADGSSFHYMIAQTFCRTKGRRELMAGDDARLAAWFSLEQMSDMERQDEIAGDCVGVVRLALALDRNGLL